ncbi:hypothetical protein [Mesorhizobium sp. M0802]|uniref:hypothetical protein n=1 Tax=Mesorhizobium sp. M0802 TaxID=2957001 RepID=UPI003335D127
MPFQTDSTWTPSTYRSAHHAWAANTAANDNAVLPRKAAPTARPRHGVLSKKLRSLLLWRAISQGSDWTSIAANDNEVDEDGKPVPLLLDSVYEIRPRLSEIYRAIEDVQFTERTHAKFDGGGSVNVIAEGGDIERGPVLVRSKRRKPDCIVRMGGLRFSNGEQAEWAPVRTERGIEYDWVRIPLGGIVDCQGGKGKWRKAGDRFGRAKGPLVDQTATPTVGMGDASEGAISWVDAVADRHDAARIRASIQPETAKILDLAMRAANFREIGEAYGHRGKHAERRGKAAVIEACEELDRTLAA